MSDTYKQSIKYIFFGALIIFFIFIGNLMNVKAVEGADANDENVTYSADYVIIDYHDKIAFGNFGSTLSYKSLDYVKGFINNNTTYKYLYIDAVSTAISYSNKSEFSKLNGDRIARIDINTLTIDEYNAQTGSHEVYITPSPTPAPLTDDQTMVKYKYYDAVIVLNESGSYSCYVDNSNLSRNIVTFKYEDFSTYETSIKYLLEKLEPLIYTDRENIYVNVVTEYEYSKTDYYYVMDVIDNLSGVFNCIVIENGHLLNENCVCSQLARCFVFLEYSDDTSVSGFSFENVSKGISSFVNSFSDIADGCGDMIDNVVSIFDFMPSEIKAVIVTMLLCVVVIGVVKVIRG